MKIIRTILFLVCLLSVNIAVEANVPIIPAEELRPGMTGYAKTVIKGVTIETFDVEILGVTGSEASSRSILVKASGPVIERSGGIAQGMSGSPVYIDGKLAGAVAYGKAFSDPKYCFLTPIEEMLALFDESTPRPSAFLPKNTPLMVSGFTPDAVDYLNDKLKSFKLKAYGVSAGKGDLSNVKLEPGSSIGVSLARGDMEIGAIGTVTWKGDDGKILAFGHPFLQRGAADYFMTNAWIFASVPNIESAFKVGAIGDVVGKVVQDRSVGIGGVLNEYPHIVPLFVSVTDKDRGYHKTCSVQLITDEALVPTLVDGITYSAVGKTMDRKGGGTSKVKFKITAQGKDGKPITIQRENMFYHANNIAKNTNEELAYACLMLMKNKFEQTTIFDVNVDVEMSSENAIAELLSAKMSNKDLKPGQVVPITLELQPYRSEKITRTINFKIPSKQKPGPMHLVVRGGSAYGWMVNLLKKQEEAGNKITLGEKKKSLDEFIQEFNVSDSNNDIVVDILPSYGKKSVPPVVAEDDKQVGDAAARGTANIGAMMRGSKYKQKFPMNFIVSGELELTAQVGE